MLTLCTDSLFTSCRTYRPSLLAAKSKTISVGDAGISLLVQNMEFYCLSLFQGGFCYTSVLMQLNTIVIVYSGNYKEVLPGRLY